jgi:KipI family sensor histidine kinase inhibitor
MSTPVFLPYGDTGVLVEVEDTAAVLRWFDALQAHPLEGVAEVVPAARTLLVVAAPGTDLGELRHALGALEVAESGPAEDEADAEVIEIPVRYDGPDLADVARLTGLSEDEVVDAHTGEPWRVAFGGFAPGFGYLSGGDPCLEVPRRDEPRTTVPAGAVGLAGTFSGVYPRESPGGWQLIGTTDATLWDLDRDPPALLRPGAVVRFVAVDR